MTGDRAWGATADDRRVIGAALTVAEETGSPAAAIELPDGRVVTGKTSDLMGPAAGAVLNALKALAGIPQTLDLISPEAIMPIQHLKVEHLGSLNPRLHSDEVLIALASSATSNPLADKAISATDMRLYKKLGLQVTCEPQYETKKLYHR